MENARLTGWQMFLLTFSFTLGTSIFIRTGDYITSAKEYAWIMPLCGGLYGAIVASLWLYLARRFPGLSIVQICRRVLGTKVGTLFASLYILFFIQISAWVLRNIGDFVSINVLRNTPITILHLTFLLVSAYTVIKGAETLAMVNEFIVPPFFIIFWTVFFLMLNAWDWENFGPAQVFNPFQLVAKTKQQFGFPFSETVCLAMLFPFVQNRLKTSIMAGIIVGAVVLSINVFCVLGIVGVYRSSHLLYPIYTLAQELRFSFFIDHLEVIISTIWIFAVSIKLSTSMYCAVLGIGQMFKLENRTFITLPLIWIILPMSLLFNSVIENLTWDIQYSFAYDMLYAIIIPMILILVLWIRQKASKGRDLA
ncbi:spore germination protein KB [Paenibacillus sp. yr247]|uniref:GerAB/ArcD/ProY family transporter n=1 Tax=Paenibacillus sp. yr247 TaxID=1761880 RepID=UPI000881C7FD|nr:endospore germination permease [Paenibacillus sp. yr247]SDP22762.1 spore germination protein KB [Paenibacillus sp. yr247]